MEVYSQVESMLLQCYYITQYGMNRSRSTMTLTKYSRMHAIILIPSLQVVSIIPGLQMLLAQLCIQVQVEVDH